MLQRKQQEGYGSRPSHRTQGGSPERSREGRALESDLSEELQQLQESGRSTPNCSTPTESVLEWPEDPVSRRERRALMERVREGGETRGRNMWRDSGLLFVDNSKRKIRWGVVRILKNNRDKNALRGTEVDYSMLEMDDLFDVLSSGCGQAEDLYETIEPFRDLPNPFLGFLKEMQKDGLLSLFKKRRGSENEIVFVSEPRARPPRFLDLVKIG